jgi:dienelactone hydrolase
MTAARPSSCPRFLLVLSLSITGCQRATPTQASAPERALSMAPAFWDAGARAEPRAALRPSPHAKGTADQALAPRVASPPAPRPPVLPRGLESLPVPGFKTAVFVSPARQDNPPWPVVLILHGNFDRPEWECEWWAASAKAEGWLLCPRGIPRTDVPRSYDRWTFTGSTPVVKESHAALDALASRFPKLLKEQDALYVGFSLGAILAARVMLDCRLRFTAAALVEGGDAIDYSQMRALARKGLSRVAFLCGQHTGCSGRVKGTLRLWSRAGIQARAWVMPGTGHGYSDDFDPLGKEVVTWLRSTAPAPK